MSKTAPTLGLTDASEVDGPRPWLLLCCVLVVVAGCYLPVFGAPFLWDDQHLIDLPIVQRLSPLREYFSASFWQHDDVGVLHRYYRPLVILSLALDHRIYGNNPGGFHVTNLIFHLLATSVLFGLLRRQGATGYLSALGCALWALYPRLTEAAAWISGRTDVLAGFFVLCALLVHRSTSRLMRMASASLLLLGLLCKETALAGVLAVLVVELRRSGVAASERVRRVAPTLGALVCYVSFRVRALGAASDALALAVAKRGPTVAEAIGRYVWMLLTPWLPDAQNGRLRVRAPAFVVLGCVVMVAAVPWAWRRRDRLTTEQAGAVALGLGSLSLALYAIPFSVSAIAADRFLYLPLAALTLVAAPLLGRCSVPFRVLAPVALAIVLSFGIATFFRAEAWADEVEFWSATLHQHPEEPSMSAVALGGIFSREGSYDEALGLFRLGSEPGMDCEELARNDTATVLLDTGRYADAARILNALASQHPKTSSTFINLALADSYLGRFDAARAALDRTLDLAPSDQAARALRDRLPALAALRHELDSLAPSESALRRARLEASLGLSREALESYRIALATGDVTPALAEEATWLALRKGDAATREAFVARYSIVAGQRLDPRLQLVYGVHRETLAKLESAWLTLGLSAVTGG